jgi:plastocyanin
MKKRSLLIHIVLLAFLASLTACTTAPAVTPTATRRPQLTPGTQPNEVDLTATGFVQHAIRIKAGQSVTFVDLLNGGPHILCIGSNSQCQFHAPGPKELLENGGLNIDAGQVRQVPFDQRGVYHITCSIHSNMNLTVTVT